MAKNNPNELPPVNRRVYDLVSEKCDGVVSRFASEIGVAQQKVDRLFKIDKRGKQTYPGVSEEIRKAICQRYGTDDRWLLAGVHVTQDGVSSNDTRYVAPYLGENLVRVPYVPTDAAASFVESLYDIEYDLDTYGIMPEKGETLDDGSYMVFQVRGNSMEPTVPDHTKILTRKIEEGYWENAAGVIVIVYGKTLTVKRILKNSLFNKNTLTLKADNPIHGQTDVERKEIRGMWQALRIVSQKIL